MISDGTLPILPPNLTKFVCFLKKLSSNLENLESIFRFFPQNVANAKSGREVVMENQEMVMEKYFVKYVETLQVHYILCF